MKAYVVISGYCYESSEIVEGVYLSEDSASEKCKEIESSEDFNSWRNYVYFEECEVLE